MRFRIPKEEIVKIGTKRERVKFLWFPKIIDGEMRWLEKTKWDEEAVFNIRNVGFYPSGYQPQPTEKTIHYKWEPICWRDKI